MKKLLGWLAIGLCILVFTDHCSGQKAREEYEESTASVPSFSSQSTTESRPLSVQRISPGSPFIVGETRYVINVYDTGSFCNISLQYDGGEKRLFTECSYLDKAYLLMDGPLNSPILLVCADEMSDDFCTVSCELDYGIATERDRKYGQISAVEASRGAVGLYHHINVLGSWTLYQEYEVSDTGILFPYNNYYMPKFYDTQGRYVTLAIDLYVSMSVNGVPTTVLLPAGTQLIPIDTDAYSLVNFRTADGRYGQLRYSVQDGETMIDGKPEWEVFSDLMYAG